MPGRPHAYFVDVVPRLNRMGEDLQLFAEDHGRSIDWQAILSRMDRITRSGTETPIEDFARWCTRMRKGLRARKKVA